MDKNTTAIIFVLLVIVGILAIAVMIQSAAIPAGAYLAGATSARQCNDKIDNDGDGYIDFRSKRTIVSDEPAILAGGSDGDESEGNILSFQLGSDPGCSAVNDISELNPNVQCDDGADNDGDGLVDYNAPGVVVSGDPPGDPGCTGPTDTDERNCGDKICQAGETCSSCSVDCGACDSCADSDGGFNTNTKGSTYGIQGGLFINATDSCATGTILTEFYCSGTTIANSQFDCAANFSTCIDGACVQGLR